jgi:hypothetical protein
MKKILSYSVGMLMLGLNAFADSTLDCRDFASDPSGSGYEVRLLMKSDKSTVASVHFAKSGEWAQLVCSEIEADPSHSDAAQPILGCHEQYMSDAGYSLVLTDEDFAGKQYVILSEVSFVGTEMLAKLPCQASRN